MAAAVSPVCGRRSGAPTKSEPPLRQNEGGRARQSAKVCRLDPMSDPTSCPHFDGTVHPPLAERCQECGSNFNLRVCTACGHVGCCESQQAHNTKHAQADGHPIIKSL